MNNQAPSRRASNHSISVQSTSLLLYARAHAAASSRVPRPLLSLENHPEREKKKERKREKKAKKGVDTSRDKKGVGERTRPRGAGRGTVCGPAIIVAFPTDKVTAPEYFLFPAADRARITRKES